jgi:hypothetical protein
VGEVLGFAVGELDERRVGGQVAASVGVGSVAPVNREPSARNTVPPSARVIPLSEVRPGMMIIPAYGAWYEVVGVRSRPGGMIQVHGAGSSRCTIFAPDDQLVTVLEAAVR